MLLDQSEVEVGDSGVVAAVDMMLTNRVALRYGKIYAEDEWSLLLSLGSRSPIRGPGLFDMTSRALLVSMLVLSPTRL